VYDELENVLLKKKVNLHHYCLNGGINRPLMCLIQTKEERGGHKVLETEEEVSLTTAGSHEATRLKTRLTDIAVASPLCSAGREAVNLPPLGLRSDNQIKRNTAFEAIM